MVKAKTLSLVLSSVLSEEGVNRGQMSNSNFKFNMSKRALYLPICVALPFFHSLKPKP